MSEVTMSDVQRMLVEGKLAAAELAMKEDVLVNHPNSPKAHFVMAEILAKAGKKEQAKAEFLIAQKIDPNFNFVTNKGVLYQLKQDLGIVGASTSTSAYTQATTQVPSMPPPQKEQTHYFAWAAGLFVLAVIIWLVLRKNVANKVAPITSNRPMAPITPRRYDGGYSYREPTGADASHYQQPRHQQPAPAGESTAASVLKTAAGVGIGVVAGSAIAEALRGGDHGSSSGPSAAPSSASASSGSSSSYSSDLGVSSGSWDSGSSSSSWDSGSSSSDSSSSDSGSSSWD